MKVRLVVLIGLLLASQARPSVWTRLWTEDVTYPDVDQKVLVQPNAPCVAVTVYGTDNSTPDTLVLTGCSDADLLNPYSLVSWEGHAHTPGTAWDEERIFQSSTDHQDPPALGFTSSYKHAVWSGVDDNGYPHLRSYHADPRSGSSYPWSAGTDVRQETNSGSGNITYRTVTLATSPCSCWVAFVRDSATATVEKSQVMAYFSTDEGTDWTAGDSWQATSGEVDTLPSVAVSADTVHLCWLESTNGGAHWALKYVRSTDGGGTWGSVSGLVSSVDPSFAPCIAAFGSHVYASYGDPTPSATNPNTMFMYNERNGAPTTWSQYRVPSTNDISPRAPGTRCYTSARLWTFPLSDGDNGILVSDIHITDAVLASCASYRTLVDKTCSDSLAGFTFQGQDRQVLFVHGAEFSVAGLWDATNYDHITYTAFLPPDPTLLYSLAFQYSPTGGGGGQSAGLFNPAARPTLALSPNPSVGETRVSYSLPKAGDASLELYDAAGALVLTLARGYATVGTHNTQLSSEKLSHGIYLLKLESEGYALTSKLVIE